MLKDSVRTGSYRSAIINNPHLFKGKNVLDVGCGTGILSMFAAKAGAKHVTGVRASLFIARRVLIVCLCRLICPTSSTRPKKSLKRTDSKIVRSALLDLHYSVSYQLPAITLVKGKLEETELPLKEYDIIISEWMGYFLLYESMLDTVLDARDKYLAKDGLIFPDTATMYIAAIEDQEYKDEKINFWDSVYGFDYSCIKDIALREPLVDTVDLKAVVSDPYMFKKIDLLTAKKEDLTFDVPFELKATRDDYVHAFLAWFDIGFECTHKHVRFSTGPHAQYTHWKQTVFYTPETLTVKEGDKITGRLTCAPNKRNPRDLDIKIAYKHGRKMRN